jgi:hypothetical protein
MDPFVLLKLEIRLNQRLRESKNQRCHPFIRQRLICPLMRPLTTPHFTKKTFA